MRKLLFTFTLMIINNLLFAQIGIGQWRDHLPYKSCIAVVDAGSKVYAATPYSLFFFSKEDQSVQRLSKVNGLSDIGISSIDYHQGLNCLVVAYRNTNVDLIKDDRIINISDIKRKQIIGNKFINSVFISDDLAYLSCGFGIVVLNISREEIKDTYYIGNNASHINVLDVARNDTALFAATEEGLYSASLNSDNLADFSNWKKNSNLPHPNAKYSLVESFAGNIIVNKQNQGYNTDTLFVYDGSIWKTLVDEFHLDNHNFSVHDSKLYVSRNEDVLVYDQNLNIDHKIWSPSNISIVARDAVSDNEGNVWIADYRNGLIKTTNNGQNGESIRIEGPDFSDVFEIDIHGNDLWQVSGGHSAILDPMYKREGFSSFVDEKWSSYHCHLGSCDWPALDTIRDMVRVEINPFDVNTVYVGSLEGGVIEFKNKEVAQVYNKTNSSLQSVFRDIERTMITGLQVDTDNNLWVLNSGVQNILSVKKSSGEWKSFNLSSVNSNIDVSNLFIDSFNQKWIIPRRSFSLIVFRDNNTIDNTADDEVRNLNNQSGNGQLFATRIVCMTEDLDGELWFGTDKGIGVIYAPANVFSGSNFDMQRIRVEWDGYIQYLLETETITAITVDAANRKWVGTQNSGVFLLSEDGEQQIHHFTLENSPLLSNEITSIKVNAEGEVFIGTANGLVSFRGEASIPRVEGSKVYAYPNPVREGYTGSIAIKNLSKDANVKITDINGNVVFETKSLGGQAIWNGHNFQGEKASTGVYLVFASNEDGSVNLVTKILFIN